MNRFIAARSVENVAGLVEDAIVYFTHIVAFL